MSFFEEPKTISDLVPESTCSECKIEKPEILFIRCQETMVGFKDYIFEALGKFNDFQRCSYCVLKRIRKKERKNWT